MAVKNRVTYGRIVESEVVCLCERLNLAQCLVDGALHLQQRYFAAWRARWGKEPLTGAERRSPVGISPTAAALVYVACRRAAVPRTFKEIAHSSGLSSKAIFRRLRRIQSVLWSNGSASSEPRMRADQYLARFCAALHLPFTVEKEAGKVLEDCSAERPIASCGAAAVAAICVALRRPTRDQLRMLSHVSCLALATIKRNFRSMWFAWALSPTSTV